MLPLLKLNHVEVEFFASQLGDLLFDHVRVV